MRLIDAGKLQKPHYAEDDNLAGAWMSPAEQDGYNEAIDDIWERIQAAPTIDAVPVVRCKGCKYGDWDSEPDDAMICTRTHDGFWRSGDDFCSFGKPKEK